MNYLDLFSFKMFAVFYSPPNGQRVPPIAFPNWPHMLTLERILILLLFILLIKPLLREQQIKP